MNNTKDLESPEEKPIERLLTPLLSKKVKPIPKQNERKPIPILKANYLSRLLFLWLIPMLNIGYKRTLQQNDLWYLEEDLALDSVYKRFDNEVQKILLKNHHKRSNHEYPKNTLFWALFRTMKWQFIFSILFKLVTNVASAFTPLLTKYLIQFVQKKVNHPETPVNSGVGYALGITALIMIQTILNNQALMLSKLVGAQSRTILTKALLEKSLVSTSKTRNMYPNGKIISMMGSDLSRIDMAFGVSPNAFGLPVPVIIGIIILIINIGVSALAGVAVFLFFTAIMSVPAKKLMKYRKASNIYTDERVSLTREILMAMKMIKFYSWEDAYEEMIKVIRQKEINYVLKFQIVFAGLFSIASSVPAITSTVAFLVLYAVSSNHNAAAIFSSLSLFNLLSQQISDFPMLLSSLIDALTALNRISIFLQTPNYDNSDYYSDELIGDYKTAIKVSNATFAWDVYDEMDQQSQVSILKNISLEIKKGEFIVITGAIGSGKSSLLSALFGQMTKTEGSVGINGSIILCSSPWVQNTTVRENILFGSEYDKQLYQDTIEACSLISDFESFKASDFTEIGERGVTLSGGQKARLNLARAVYSNKDIYLLDDVLSAVDANVGQSITRECFLGLLSKKTRVLATHQLSLINTADRIIFIDSNGDIDFGTELELMNRNREFIELMAHNQIEEESQSEIEDEKKDDEIVTEVKLHTFVLNDNIPENYKIISEEERAINSIPLSIYKKYFDAGQGFLSIFSLPVLFFIISLGVFDSLFANVWLSFWIEKKYQNLSEGIYIGLYILFTFLQVPLFSLEFSLFSYITTKASQILNIMAVHRILHTPMRYMDTTPIGRIINRFSKDTNSLDNEIGSQLKTLLHVIAQCVGIIILAIIYIPWFAITTPFILLVVVCITNYYQASSREVKRLEAINRSFILNNFNEVLSGLATIKAYNSESRFIKRNTKYSDQMNEVYFIVNANQRWISVCLNVIAGFIVLIVSLLVVTGVFNLSASSAGVLTSYMITLAQLMGNILRTYCEVENEMNSVERVCQYAYELEQEAPYLISESTPAPEWPQHGNISFQNIDLRYREGLPLILKKLSFEVEAGSKIGICGRTGAGKSSLMAALYRIVELSDGRIEIDGVDISKLGLHQLRSKLSIIPQDPVLFKGTLRRNLDPFDDHTDEELWDSLRRSGLLRSDNIEEIKIQLENYHKFHLFSQVEDEGSNFSLGERQLIALARALVRNSQILIMDEATSSVDYDTDSKIQATIATEFKNCTVLCIAHRLRTIIHHDKILVLENGKMEEFGEPLDLFRNNKVFTEMCLVSGLAEENFL